MENTLEQLREKKRAYIKAEAQKIVDEMVRRGVTTDTDTSCPDAHFGWDAERHASMPQICEELRKMGIASSSKVNFGVTDWVFTLIG
jgi:hypothetical protein